MKKDNICYYNTCVRLNKEDSPSSSSIVCYHGDIKRHDSTNEECMFITISDCYGKIILHKTSYDTKEDFIEKIDKIIEQLVKFKEHLVSDKA